MSGASRESILQRGFWKGRRVLITGHTGFKGSWLSIWLSELGASTFGFSLPPAAERALFLDAGVAGLMSDSTYGDIRDPSALGLAIERAQPEVIFHLAAQPLVRASYSDPIETYSTNVLGTARLLEAMRTCSGLQAFVNVTTDKVYENREWPYRYREIDRLGGNDPYSSSKACAELVTWAFRESYFNARTYAVHGVSTATARSGNVIGGGDWACDRLVPDAIRAFSQEKAVRIRSPGSTRPWQHVLEPLSGYLVLAERLAMSGTRFGGPWNFGPQASEIATVEEVMRRLVDLWGEKARYTLDNGDHPHEAGMLALDSSKAQSQLGWRSKWDLQTSLEKTVEWYKSFLNGQDALALCRSQIQAFAGAST